MALQKTAQKKASTHQKFTLCYHRSHAFIKQSSQAFTQIFLLNTSSAAPSLQTMPSTKHTDLPESVSLSHGWFHLHYWASAQAGKQGEQYLAGEKSFPSLCKNSMLTTAALPAHLLLPPLGRKHHHPPWY